MNHMSAIAEQLQNIEQATQDFLMRWAVDELMAEVANNARMHRDIMAMSDNFSHGD